MIVELRDRFEVLRDALERFSDAWMPHVVQAEVFVSPVNASGLAPKTIPVERYWLQDAAERAARAFQTLHFLPGQHPATAYRLPGWIGVSADVGEAIAAVNREKDALKTLVLTIPERERNRTTRQALPGVSLLQCYRHLVQWAPAPERLYFSWAGATPSSVHVSRDVVLAQLERARSNVPEQFTREDWEAVIALQRQQLADTPPDTPLIYRWRKAPHPRLMAYNRGQTSNAGRIVPANLPVFVVVEDGALPKVHGLDDFDIANHLRESPRADAALLSTVIDSLGLYAQLSTPPNRKQAPGDPAGNASATSRNADAGRKAIDPDA